jgi:glycosyltransferase involved in cell wall biosynthesis
MRIGIDARFYGPVGKGLGRYTQEVVDNIIKINEAEKSADFCYVIFLSPENFEELEINSSRVEKIKVACPWYSFREQLLMPFYLKRAKLDLVHFPHFNVPLFISQKFVVTIHDLILTHFPTIRATTKSSLVYWFKNLAYRVVVFMALRRSKKIITVSNFTKQDIINKFKVSPDKIVVTYEGAANLAQGNDSLFLAKLDKHESGSDLNLPKDFLLYVGSAYPHKNLEILLDVFAKLKSSNSDLRLVLVGRSDYFYERLKLQAVTLKLWSEKGSDNQVIFTGYLSDENLEALYIKARAYIFPSFYEGFGLPPLEAMSKSCPVLSSNQASLPEVLGDAALYFNPFDQGDILSKINIILSDRAQRFRLVAKGLEQVKKYDWKKCAQMTRTVYLNILNKV